MARQGRRPRFTTPLTDARNFFVQSVKRPIRWFRPTTRFLIYFFALALLTTLLLARTRSALTSGAEMYQEGDVVRADVVSPADFTAEDSQESESRREAMRRDSPQIWDYDPTQIESAAQSFRASWASLKQQTEAHAATNNNVANHNNQRERTEIVWPGAGADRQSIARVITAHNFDAGALELLTHLMRDAGSGYVFDERDAVHIKPEMRVVDTRGGAQTIVNGEQGRFVPLAVARENLRSRIKELSGWSDHEREMLASALLPLLKTTVTFNPTATDLHPITGQFRELNFRLWERFWFAASAPRIRSASVA